MGNKGTARFSEQGSDSGKQDYYMKEKFDIFDRSSKERIALHHTE
jgi:hypothetical protein